MVALTAFDMENRLKRPPGGKIMMTSYPACNKTSVISETMHPRLKFTMERYREVMVALSESVMKNRVKRPLAEE